MENRRVLLVEPYGDYIRQDRCNQSINSWGGVNRFPLNLNYIGSYMSQLGAEVIGLDLRANPNTNFEKLLKDFTPTHAILSSGFPSMRVDNKTAKKIKEILPSCHVSTFGAASSSLSHNFFSSWNFKIYFDSIIGTGDWLEGYKQLIFEGKTSKIISIPIAKSYLQPKIKFQMFFNPHDYVGPFTGKRHIYVAGSTGCKFKCSFCLVPILYGPHVYYERSVNDILEEIELLVKEHGTEEIVLWDEGTTQQTDMLDRLCDGFIELQKKEIQFTWSTRSTVSLIVKNPDLVKKMRQSQMTGITLGLESFDEAILKATGKGTTVFQNREAVKILHENDIKVIGHVILGLPDDSEDSIKKTIEESLKLKDYIDVLQFYCCTPYPGTALYDLVEENNLLKPNLDLTELELNNATMSTLKGVSWQRVQEWRNYAMERANEILFKKHRTTKLFNERFVKKWSVR